MERTLSSCQLTHWLGKTDIADQRKARLVKLWSPKIFHDHDFTLVAIALDVKKPSSIARDSQPIPKATLRDRSSWHCGDWRALSRGKAEELNDGKGGYWVQPTNAIVQQRPVALGS